MGEKFRTQLTKLMATVGKTKPFFIRCVKPNHVRAAHRFETKLAVEQLTYAGVFEAVTIRKKGYPFRCTHAQFAAKYRWITRKADGWAPINVNPNGAPKDYCVAVLGSVVQDFSAVQVGVTLMLYRADEHRVLELLKNLALGRVFQHMQASFRAKMGRVYRKLLRQAKQALGGALAAINAAPSLLRKRTADSLQCRLDFSEFQSFISRLYRRQI